MSDKHNITNIGSKQRTNDSEQVRSESEGYSNVPSAEESSEESDANSVKSQASDSASECPICLRSFSSQAVGYPEDCASKLHIFCALCIEEWSKNVTTCPIDRKEFSVLCILDNIKNRNCIRKVRVEKREYREELEENGVEDLTYCEVCRLANREHMMLLCDDCDKGYHMDCLTPVLREVPAGSWFCPRCDPERVSDEASEIENVEEVVPRIIRTRQNERIRRAILMRTVAASIINEPGPSRLSNVIQSTLERVTRRMNSDKKRRRRRRKYKTVVKEYEVNSENEKFPSKRSRKVMRSKKSRKKKPRKKKESCFEGFEQGNSSFDSLRVRAGIPTLRLFEPANNLDYFSDENEELETGEVGEEIGYGLTVIRNVRPIGISRGLMKRKVAVRAPDPINILDIIMNNQEKWHSKRVSEEVILRNGKPVFKPIPKHTEAPLNGTEGNNERLAVNSSVPPNETRSGTNNSSATNEGSNTSSTANGASTIDAGNNDESGNILGLARFGYIPEEPNKPSQENAFDSDMFREDEEDSCPNFSVYSSEAMTMAQQQEKSQEIQGPMIETDVDLVQLSGEEESSETGKKGDFEHIANKWKPVVAEAQKDESERYKLLALYDSDGGLEDGVAQEELERSYTPCLDERLCDVVGEGLQQVVGIDGMETELISEEEDNNLNETQPESLFKCNVSKKRNYRENRSKSPKIKNQSDDKENKESRKKQDKKELPRYDVRNVIAKASRRDPFGRNKDRNRSRSRSRHSFSESRKSFTISRSPSYDRSKRRNSPSRSKSPYSRRRSKSPKRRSRTPRRRSPLARRRRSNTRSRSRTSVHRSTDIISHKRRSGTTSPVANKGETNKRKKEREKSGKRKRVKEKIKKKRTRSSSKNIEQSWTPPLGALPKPAENLRVVVSNKNRSESPVQSKKKKEKKRRADKKKEKHRKEHRKFRNETMTHETSRPKTASSKEVFASGDNILVSVSFNNISHQERQEAPLVQAQKTAAPEKRTQVKISSKTHPTKSKDTRAHIRKCETKPVAIIDLDNSPFNEVPPSPVIVLSDSDREDNSVSHDDFPKTSVPSKEAISSEVIRPPASPSESPILDEPTFRAPAGPKTPPEPPQTVKFSMIPLKSTRIRQINTIFEQERENDEETAETGSKMGPNTPPEPTPSSPDAYDPFEPTKSPSEHSCEANDTNDGPGSRSSTPTLEETEANLCKSSETMGITEKLNTTMNPVELVMSLINKNSGAAPALSQHINDDHQAMQTEIDGDLTSDLIVEKQIHVLSNVVVTPIKTGIFGRPATSSLSVSTPLKTPAKSPASTSKSVTKIRNAGGSIISKLPLPPRKQGSAGAEGIEIDSPYSPGSSDFDDLFEPPSSTTDTYSKLHKQTVTSSTNNRPMTVAGKIEMFDNLFGSASPLHKFTTVSSTYKPKNTKNKKKQKSKKLDDDEIPSSAVDLQNKDKLLRKLNRQERVIDEVKLVIKPHYNKKRITKEEYKEIMRKAVPKVCHSKSGEINPVKIQALVEAYVKKVRYRRKMQMKGQNS